MAAVAPTEPVTPKPEKKHKRDKTPKSDRKKKREREEDVPADGERKHKKSKSAAADPAKADEPAQPPREEKHRSKKKEERHASKKEKEEKHASKKKEKEEKHGSKEDKEEKHRSKKEKKKRDKKSRPDGEADAAVAQQTDENAPAEQIKGRSMEEEEERRRKKKKRKHEEEGAEASATAGGAGASAALEQDGAEGDDGRKARKEKKKKSKKHANDEGAAATTTTLTAQEPDAEPRADADADAMDVDQPKPAASSSTVYQPPDMPEQPQFPFFAQTVSLYEPLYPGGWAQPVSSCKFQHLQQLQNKYVPSLRGVLLGFGNVTLGPAPGRGGAGTAADDEAPTTLASRGEYAPGFGWITADVELFVPSRGAWMEGSVNLQTEGHVGVVCFGRFNASIEARRLPPAWRWVASDSPEAQALGGDAASVVTADDDHGVVRHVHSTGFWVDAAAARVAGRLRFRIRNFHAGRSGDASFLSLEGTMLDREAEKRLVREEACAAQLRRAARGGRPDARRRTIIPDFATTRFAPDGADDGPDQAARDAALALEAS